MVIMEEPRLTDIWLGMKEDRGAKAPTAPHKAAARITRKDFILLVGLL